MSEMSYFSPWLVFHYSYCWPITTPRGFCDKRISSNVCITLALSSTVPIARPVNLMFNKNWLSVTKLFGCDQFSVHVYWSIFPSKRDSTQMVNQANFLCQICCLFKSLTDKPLRVYYPFGYTLQYLILKTPKG